MDVVILDHRSTISVVARNEKGEILRTWAKHLDGGDPIKAETHAMLWALDLALMEDFHNIAIEGDAKLCFDAIGNKLVSPWSIGSLIDNIGDKSNLFLSCSFSWVRREANFVAHAMAKFASAFSSLFPPICFNLSALPQAVWDAWSRDVLTV